MSNTDTNQASGLYELSREVYEKTGWKPTDWQHGIENGQPIYTSDYLLEKLPKTLERPNDAYGALWGKPNLTLLDDGLWEASYRYEDEMNPPDFCYVNEHFTPLKALLKLTIALSEAGELK